MDVSRPPVGMNCMAAGCGALHGTKMLSDQASSQFSSPEHEGRFETVC